MVDYRRNFVPGGTFFFTVTLTDRRSTVLVDHVDLLRQSLREAVQARPFRVDALVVLPEHLHTVWTLPPGDTDYPGRWMAIKSAFTRALVSAGVPLQQNARGEYRLWQRRYWEHTIRNERDLQRHIDYIHNNPVKHGYARRPADWPHSSFHRYVENGILPEDWAAPTSTANVDFGE